MYASILQSVRSLRVSRLVGAGLAASIALVVSATGCDQSSPLCRTGTGAYTIKYTLTSGTGSCAELTTDTLFVNSYNDVGEDGRPDLEKVSAALAPAALAAQLDAANARLGLGSGGDPDPDKNHHHWSWGHFKTPEPVGDFCEINVETQALQAFPELPPRLAVASIDENKPPTPNDLCDDTPAVSARPAVPATTVSYEFTNWRVYFTAAHAGNSFNVHLKYTVDGNSCEYDARAALFGQRQSCDKGDGTALPEACDPVAHPDITTLVPNEKCDPATGQLPVGEPELVTGGGLGTGSGVDPDFDYTCDPTLTCVLARDVPALK